MGGYNEFQAEFEGHVHTAVEEGEFAFGGMVCEQANGRAQGRDGSDEFFVFGKGADGVAGDVDTLGTDFDHIAQVLDIGRLDVIIRGTAGGFCPHNVGGYGTEGGNLASRDFGE